MPTSTPKTTCNTDNTRLQCCLVARERSAADIWGGGEDTRVTVMEVMMVIAMVMVVRMMP